MACAKSACDESSLGTPLLFVLKEMAANQSEEDAAQMRRRTGVTRVDSVFRDDRHRPHPGGGGSRGYDIIL